MSKSQGALCILIAEDNRADSYLLRESILQEHSECELHILEDGDEAYQFLIRKGPYADAPRPDIVVLDLNLPKRDGAELLTRIRENATLKDITVAVVSSAPEEVAAISLKHADCYIQKPTRLAQFMQVGRAILDCFHSTKRAA